MHNLPGYLFLTESVLAVAKKMKGTLILHDGNDIDVEMLKYCIGNAKDELACAKFLYSLIHALTNQNELNLITARGNVVGIIKWSKEQQTYIEIYNNNNLHNKYSKK